MYVRNNGKMSTSLYQAELMRSARSLGRTPTSTPLAADDITELHAARLLLLFHVCGSADKIEGLTKLAKLDFFVRYPDFFERIAQHAGKETAASSGYTESPMVRHHYGPWDKRYYQILAFLEARDLITVQKVGRSFEFELTTLGKDKAKHLKKAEQFSELVSQMAAVKKLLGRKNGTDLKNLVYAVFDAEVKQRSMGEYIR